MRTVDTSVAVAAALPWHEAYESARAELAERPRLIGHVAVETYSVLTRLPPPRRVSDKVARAFLARAFAHSLLTLSANGYANLLDDAAERGIVGGGIYDALVAVTAKEAGATLVTFDQRAARTYALVEADYRVIAR